MPLMWFVGNKRLDGLAPRPRLSKKVLVMEQMGSENFDIYKLRLWSTFYEILIGLLRALEKFHDAGFVTETFIYST